MATKAKEPKTAPADKAPDRLAEARTALTAAQDRLAKLKRLDREAQGELKAAEKVRADAHRNVEGPHAWDTEGMDVPLEYDEEQFRTYDEDVKAAQKKAATFAARVKAQARRVEDLGRDEARAIGEANRPEYETRIQRCADAFMKAGDEFRELADWVHQIAIDCREPTAAQRIVPALLQVPNTDPFDWRRDNCRAARLLAELERYGAEVPDVRGRPDVIRGPQPRGEK